ncbi:MAG: hypothetical protein EXX96DRAFT_547274 [Benjaminiella poitrasii]|nr:MAG: hypothetical protein EXX96DRAFT_547274 [Benjaminiella poitrasii]
MIEESNLSSQEQNETVDQSPQVQPTSVNEVDKSMTDAETSSDDSVIDDFEKIANRELQAIEQEIIDTKCFHWEIQDWNNLEHRCTGPMMKAGELDWNILLFPKGNNQTEFASIYLELANVKNTETDEYACAQFVICLSNLSDPTRYIVHSAQHRFTRDESDWGFTRFISLDEFHNSPNTILENNSIRVTTIIRVVRDPTGILWHNFVNYDSKKVTGYVGLQNQGATCYMNSLFQSLYFTNSFRKAVYQIPTENDEPTRSIALALQRVFYNLQFSNNAVGTTELTKSFGWDSLEAFRQHDVQEFNRVLQDNLEIKMKNTPADGAIKNLFVGRMKSYIKCINVKFESSRSEDYYDIQLNVKGCKNLEDSFKDYITEETLEGDNKYMAEGYGLQDAKKGVIFESFPPVLHLQLKRFEYDMMRDMMVKINDRHEFPTEINLEPYLSENADKSKGHKYILHGVLVHSGDLTGGHYFAFVKPGKEDKWLKFDDDRVIPATLKEVLEENYGGEQLGFPNVNVRPNGRPMNRFTNAYMLVYIRECMLDEVLAPVTEEDIPNHLSERLKSEARLREIKRKEKEEQHLYMKVLIADDDTFRANTGFDFANFDEREVSENHIHVLKIRKDQTFGQFKNEIAKGINLPTSAFRFWLMVNRQNRTVRIDVPIPEEEDNTTLDDIRSRYAINQTSLRLYLERANIFDESGSAIFRSPQESTQLILIFVKLFNPEYQRIHGIGHIYAQKEAKVSTIISTLKQMAAMDENEDVLLFEEIKANMIEPVDFNATFTQAELQDGDILCIQRKLTSEEEDDILENNGKTTVPEFLGYELGKVQICFGPLTPDADSPELRLILHKEMGYEEIAAHVARELNVDADKLRLINPYQGNKAHQKRFGGLKLGKILQNAYAFGAGNVNANRIRFLYEKLNVSLDEIESKCSVSVTVCAPTLKDLQVIEVLVPKDSDINDLKKALVAKGAKLDGDELDFIRIFDETDGKFDKEYDDKLWQEVIATNPAIKVYAEQIPKEELDMDETDSFIGVFHFQRIPSRTHSVPFKFLIKNNETLSETKKRLQARTGLDDNEWSKVKINIVSEDDENVTLIDEDKDTLFPTHSYKIGYMIGLDHIDKTIKIDKTGAIFIRG